MSSGDRSSGAAATTGVGETAPLSHGQRALWFVHSLAPESIAYQGMYLWRVPGAVDADRLAAAVERLGRRHPALRTTFALTAGEVRQRVEEESPIRLRVIDAAGWSDAEIEAHADVEAERPYDLERGPFIRPRLYRRGAEDHWLLFAIHHVVLDHWSIAGLIHELQALYRDPEAALPDPGATYLEFVRWQREMVAGAQGEAHWSYWREQLGGGLPALELPTDRPRPPLQTFRGGHLIVDLDADSIRRLQAYAGRRSATLFMVLLAAFQLLLRRYTGQEDVVVGTPMAARGAPRFERVVGYFTNLVPLRSDLSGDPTFDELVEQVRGHALDGLQHQDFPFVLMVERLGLERDPSRAPLTDVIFAWEGAPPTPPGEGAGEGETLELDLVALRQLGAAVDTAWSAFQRGDSIALAIQYNADLFDRATLERMAAHYRTLVEAVAHDPRRPISSYPLMTGEEERRLLVEWNDTAADFPAERCFHQLFAERAAEMPDAPALAFAGETLSYGELEARANRLAVELSGLGVEPGVRVGLALERSLELVVGMLATLKAGGAFVPLDPAYPPQRLAFMLEDARVPVLLTQEHLEERLPEHAARVVRLGPDAGAGEAGAPAVEAPDGAGPDDLAYVIYTSGSTGRPKGVMVPHRGLVNVSEEQRRTFGLGPGQRVLQFASLSFDASIWEVVMALRWGGTLHLARQEELLPGPALARLLRERRIQLVTLPPSALAAMEAAELPDLETIMVAGERCSADVVRRWAPGRRFFNLYGPTEATIWSTYARLEPGVEGQPPIGGPIGNTRVYVLDRELRPVPTGVPGELAIGGAGVTRGYLGRPGLTAERFVADPWAAEPDARLYLSGDRVRWLASGELEFLGRLDHQVKLRGYRIELGEVEAVLREQPGVSDAVALIRGEGVQQQLVAWTVVGAGAPPPDELVARLRTRLPEYMVPRRVVPLDRLPLTPNGKIDLAALPAPEQGAARGAASPGAPATGLEARVAGIWKEVLEVEQVGSDDNFFDLGGHSLLLARVQERLERLVGRPIGVSELFRYPTVAGLARHLADEGGEPADSGAAARARARRRGAQRARRRRSRS